MVPFISSQASFIIANWWRLFSSSTRTRKSRSAQKRAVLPLYIWTLAIFSWYLSIPVLKVHGAKWAGNDWTRRDAPRWRCSFQCPPGLRQYLPGCRRKINFHCQGSWTDRIVPPVIHTRTRQWIMYIIHVYQKLWQVVDCIITISIKRNRCTRYAAPYGSSVWMYIWQTCCCLEIWAKPADWTPKIKSGIAALTGKLSVRHFSRRLLENYCFVLLTNKTPPQISDNRPDMRHRALFVRH